MTDGVWNIVLIALVALSALGVVAFISLIDMGMGGMMGGAISCGAGMASGWLVGFLFIALVAGAGLLLVRHKPRQ